MIIRIGLILVLISFLALSGTGMGLVKSELGILAKRFPDKEVCSLGCGVSWDTFVPLHSDFSESGWNAKVGDIINWMIEKDAPDSYRFDGLFTVGNGIRLLEMHLNGQRIDGVYADGKFTASKDYYLVAKDLISVRVLEVNGDGFVESIQPTGLH